MDIVTVLFPIVSTHITSTFCPISENAIMNQNMRNTPSQKISRTLVWPIMSAFVGFAWLFARNKAIAVSASKTTKAATKGARKVVNSLSKMLKKPTSTTIDLAFIILVVLINFFLWFYMCENRQQETFYTLIAIFIGIILINYMIGSYTATSLILMTPLLLYVFLLLQDEIRIRYQRYSQSKAESAINAEDETKATVETVVEGEGDDEIKEKFKVW